MNANSYDPRMENLSLLISYPRSGSHWINCVLELYYDRPRLRKGPVSFLNEGKRQSNYLWFHDHDIFSDLKITHDRILYLYRNPDDVIYSLLTAEHNKINNRLVDEQIKLLRNHFKKYLISGFSKEIVRYETLKSVNYREFRKIIKFFNKNHSVDRKKLNDVLKIVKKGKVIKQVINLDSDKRYFHNQMLSNQYESNRKKFKHKYGDYIYNKLISKEFEPFFA